MQPQLLFFDTGSGPRLVSVDTERTVYGPRTPCPVDPRHILPGAPLTAPSLVLRSPPSDLFVTDGLDRMVTGRVRDIFLEAGITGWEAELVGARYTGARAASLGEPPSLWRLVTTGWGGIAPARSGLRRVEGPCPGCGKQVYRGALDPSRLFDCERWDGSDIFMIWPFPAYVWVTPRVADVVRANNLKGARLLSLADPEARVFAAAAELGVGTWRLSNYMPRDRARELGTPLGIA